MYCLISLPRAGSIATYSWLLEALSKRKEEYKDPVDTVFKEATNPLIFQKVAEVFEEINTNKRMYADVKTKYNDLEQTLMPHNYYYDLRLYETLVSLNPLPVVSLKVGKSYAIMNKFIENPNYKTIVLTRKDLKQQFLSFIVSTRTQTYHGNKDTIFKKRQNFDKIEVHPVMFSKWFDWMFRLHRLKYYTDYTFYFEDIQKDPKFFLSSLQLPHIENYESIIQKTVDTDFIKYIKNPVEFETTWSQYTRAYRGMF